MYVFESVIHWIALFCMSCLPQNIPTFVLLKNCIPSPLWYAVCIETDMKKYLFATLLCFIVSFPLLAQRMVFYVADTKANCFGVSRNPCLQVKEKPNEPYSLFYAGIEGFTYEEGYNYKLEVMRVKRDNPPADGSAYAYYLIKVMNKERSKTYVQSTISIPDQVPMQLKRLNRTGRMEVLAGANTPDILFDKRTGRISGKAGCNRYFGKVMFDNSKLLISDVGSTQMACADEKVETVYLKHLMAANRYQVQGNNLLLYKDQELLLEFSLPNN